MHISSTLAVPDTADTPHHVVVIMDGNGRWTIEWHLPRVVGYSRGLGTVRATVEATARRGVGYLTLLTFSSENWRRPVEEATFLMKLFMAALRRKVNKLHDGDIRLRVVDDLSAFNPRIQLLTREAGTETVVNPGLIVMVFANYGGRQDILRAMRALPATQSDIAPDTIIEEMLVSYMAPPYASEPDLFICTGDEQRIGNPLLWQFVYSELYFTDRYWPDFDTAEFDRASTQCRNRECRSGHASAQLDPDVPLALPIGT